MTPVLPGSAPQFSVMTSPVDSPLQHPVKHTSYQKHTYQQEYPVQEILKCVKAQRNIFVNSSE